MTQPYDVEISGTKEDSYMLPVNSPDAQEWSVYKREESGVMMWHEDFNTLSEARAYAQAISKHSVWERTE